MTLLSLRNHAAAMSRAASKVAGFVREAAFGHKIGSFDNVRRSAACPGGELVLAPLRHSCPGELLTMPALGCLLSCRAGILTSATQQVPRHFLTSSTPTALEAQVGSCDSLSFPFSPFLFRP